MTQKQFSLKQALRHHRRLGIRLQLEGIISDLADGDIRLLQEALTRHGVVCVVNQPSITPRQLHEFAQNWGEVIELPRGLALYDQEPGLPSITRVGNIRPDGSIVPGVKFAEYWHHDGDFWQPRQNFIVNFLSSVRIPSTGGRTGFFDSRGAYEALTDSQKTSLSNAHIWVRASEISDFKKALPHELPPDAQHAVCLPHPLTEQTALYLPDSSTGIQAEDGGLLTTAGGLIDSLLEDVGHHEHVWKDGDLLITDNLQVMHRSMGGYGNHPRLLYRCQSRLAYS